LGGFIVITKKNLSDTIAEYINKNIEEKGGKFIFERKSLSKDFDCIPSQINYVLETRFTKERGYVVTSKSGGGGYIKVVKLKMMANLNEQETGLLKDILAAYKDKTLSKEERKHYIRLAFDDFYEDNK
jgi:transcriptional regulator CtsR